MPTNQYGNFVVTDDPETRKQLEAKGWTAEDYDSYEVAESTVKERTGTDVGVGGALKRGITTGLVEVYGAPGSWARGLGRATSIQTLENAGYALEKAKAKQLQALAPPPDLKAIDPTEPRWWAYSIGSTIPSLGAQVLANAALSGLGVPVGAARWMSAGLVSAVEGSGAISESLAKGDTGSTALAKGLGVTLGIGLLNKISFDTMVPISGSGIGSKLLKLGKSAATEAFTEGLEEPLQDLAVWSAFQPNLVERMVAVGLPAFVLGGAGGAFASIVDPQIEDLMQAPSAEAYMPPSTIDYFEKYPGVAASPSKAAEGSVWAQRLMPTTVIQTIDSNEQYIVHENPETGEKFLNPLMLQEQAASGNAIPVESSEGGSIAARSRIISGPGLKTDKQAREAAMFTPDSLPDKQKNLAKALAELQLEEGEEEVLYDDAVSKQVEKGQLPEVSLDAARLRGLCEGLTVLVNATESSNQEQLKTKLKSLLSTFLHKDADTGKLQIASHNLRQVRELLDTLGNSSRMDPYKIAITETLRDLGAEVIVPQTDQNALTPVQEAQLIETFGKSFGMTTENRRGRALIKIVNTILKNGAELSGLDFQTFLAENFRGFHFEVLEGRYQSESPNYEAVSITEYPWEGRYYPSRLRRDSKPGSNLEQGLDESTPATRLESEWRQTEGIFITTHPFSSNPVTALHELTHMILDMAINMAPSDAPLAVALDSLRKSKKAYTSPGTLSEAFPMLMENFLMEPSVEKDLPQEIIEAKAEIRNAVSDYFSVLKTVLPDMPNVAPALAILDALFSGKLDYEALVNKQYPNTNEFVGLDTKHAQFPIFLAEVAAVYSNKSNLSNPENDASLIGYVKAFLQIMKSDAAITDIVEQLTVLQEAVMQTMASLERMKDYLIRHSDGVKDKEAVDNSLVYIDGLLTQYGYFYTDLNNKLMLEPTAKETTAKVANSGIENAPTEPGKDPSYDATKFGKAEVAAFSKKRKSEKLFGTNARMRRLLDSLERPGTHNEWDIAGVDLARGAVNFVELVTNYIIKNNGRVNTAIMSGLHHVKLLITGQIDPYTDEDRRLLRENSDPERKALVIEMVQKLNSEAGRMLSEASRQSKLENALAEFGLFVQALPLAQTNKIAPKLKAIREKILTSETPLETLKSELANIDTVQFSKRLMLSLFYNSLLSNPSTHAGNTIFNVLWLHALSGHRMLTGIVDSIYSNLTGRPRSVYAGEGMLILRAMYNGFGGSWGQANRAFKNAFNRTGMAETITKTEEEMGLVNAQTGELRTDPIETYLQEKLGQSGKKLAIALTTPSRFLIAMDAWVKALAERGQEAALRERFSKLSGIELEVAKIAFIKSSLQNWRMVEHRLRQYKIKNKYQLAKLIATDESIKEHMDRLFEAAIRNDMAKFAEHSTFQDMPGPITDQILRLRNRLGPLGRVAIPFIQTITNITKRGLELTPGLGIAVSLHGKQSGQEIIAKQIEAAVLTMIVYTLIESGKLVGAPPEDKEERDLFYAEGKLPYSVSFGGTYFQYRRVEPFSLPISLLTDLYSSWKNAETDTDAFDLFVKSVMITRDHIVDNTWMRTVSAALGEEYDLKNQIWWTTSSFVPYSGFWRGLNNQFEMWREGEVKIKDRTFLSTFGDSLPPGLSDLITAQSRINAMGEEVGRKAPFDIRALPWEWLPVKFSTETPDPVEAVFREIEYYPSYPGKYLTLRPKGKRVEVPDDLYRDYVLTCGRKAKESVMKLVSRPYFNSLPTARKRKLVMDVWNKTRDKERDKLRRILRSTSGRQLLSAEPA